MRRKRWLTVAMVVTAAVAVMMAATSYKEIGKKLEMQGEDPVSYTHLTLPTIA